jgi:uncharacterized protein YbjT (DUF2867 family)
MAVVADQPRPQRVLVAGATGVVGREVLALALADPRVSQIVAPTRRPLPPHPKLDNPVVDFSRLSADASWWQVDAVICALGTTMRLAGSEAAFEFVDLALPARIGALARSAGATRYALNSSLGASLTGNFYLRTKAAAEQTIRDLGFSGLTIVRPSLIDSPREVPRPGEQVGRWVMRAFRPLIPRRYRAVSPDRIAAALLEGALGTRVGEWIIESASLQD